MSTKTFWKLIKSSQKGQFFSKNPVFLPHFWTVFLLPISLFFNWRAVRTLLVFFWSRFFKEFTSVDEKNCLFEKKNSYALRVQTESYILISANHFNIITQSLVKDIYHIFFRMRRNIGRYQRWNQKSRLPTILSFKRTFRLCVDWKTPWRRVRVNYSDWFQSSFINKLFQR